MKSRKNILKKYIKHRKTKKHGLKKNKNIKLTKSKKKKKNTMKERKTKKLIKKGGFNIVEDSKYTKKQTRWINNKQKYELLKPYNCDNISNKEDLIKKLNENFVNRTLYINGNPKKLDIYPNSYNIFPYCNEDLKGPASLDKVNSPFTSNSALFSLFKVFKSSFNPVIPVELKGDYKLEDNSNADNYGITSPLNNPEKFINAIKKENTNLFIVSHSGFMSKLYKYIIDTNKREETLEEGENNNDYDNGSYEGYYDDSLMDMITNEGVKVIGGSLEKKLGLKKEKEYGVFDNLDILQILMESNGNISHIIIRRFINNYKVNNEPVIGNLSLDGKKAKSIFIMRHCLGCHNVTPGIMTKIGQATEQYKSGKNLGYLDWSMCFEDTIDEMVYVGKDVYNLLQLYGGYKSYTFGSSVIFRAMLTSILMFNVINNTNNTGNQNSITMEEEDIISGLREPKDNEI